jgi:hypothetical protein
LFTVCSLRLAVGGWQLHSYSYSSSRVAVPVYRFEEERSL